MRSIQSALPLNFFSMQAKNIQDSKAASQMHLCRVNKEECQHFEQPSHSGRVAKYTKSIELKKRRSLQEQTLW